MSDLLDDGSSSLKSVCHESVFKPRSLQCLAGFLELPDCRALIRKLGNMDHYWWSLVESQWGIRTYCTVRLDDK